MHARLNGNTLEEVDCCKYLGRKWHWIEVVKGMWYTDGSRGIERGEPCKVC